MGQAMDFLEILENARVRRQRALQLVNDQQKTYREAAAIMGVSAVRINQMVHRAKKDHREMPPLLMRIVDVRDKARARRLHALSLIDDGRLTYKAAAKSMGVSVSCFGNLVAKARKELRAMAPAVDRALTP